MYNLCLKVCYVNLVERFRFIRCIYNLLNLLSLVVRYEVVGILVIFLFVFIVVKVYI